MDQLTPATAPNKHQKIITAVHNYGKRLQRFIRSRVNTVEDAEDIMQDVWYQLSYMIDTEPIEQMSGQLCYTA